MSGAVFMVSSLDIFDRYDQSWHEADAREVPELEEELKGMCAEAGTHDFAVWNMKTGELQHVQIETRIETIKHIKFHYVRERTGAAD